MFCSQFHIADHVSLVFRLSPFQKGIHVQAQAKGKEATKGWIADRAKPLLQSNPGMTAIKMKDHLEHQFPLKLSYNKVWEGRQRALEGLHGT